MKLMVHTLGALRFAAPLVVALLFVTHDATAQTNQIQVKGDDGIWSDFTAPDGKGTFHFKSGSEITIGNAIIKGKDVKTRNWQHKGVWYRVRQDTLAENHWEGIEIYRSSGDRKAFINHDDTGAFEVLEIPLGG